MVDTNSNPEGIDFVIPSNDDASQSVRLIVRLVCDAIGEGLTERKAEKEKEDTEAAARKERKRNAAAKKAEDKKEVKEEKADKSEKDEDDK